MKEKLKKIYGEPLTFTNGAEMLDAISGKQMDLYCLEKETYVFSYNGVGSIAVYDWIDEAKANELINFQEISFGEYWGADLGPGGEIYDDDNYGVVDEGPAFTGANLDWCNKNFDGEWFVVYEG